MGKQVITPELEKRLEAYLYLKDKGLTLEEVCFLAQEYWPKIILDKKGGE